MVWFLVLSRLHQEKNELIQLKQGALGALERPHLSSTLPVDAGDTDSVG
jgi:hypothetical protein